MIRFFIFCFVLLNSSLSAREHKITFLRKKSAPFYGNIVGINDKYLMVKRKGLKRPSRILLDKVSSISFLKNTKIKEDKYASIGHFELASRHIQPFKTHLKNDLIKGEILNIDEKQITIKSKFANNLKLHSDFIQFFKIINRSAYLFEGAKELSAWNISPLKDKKSILQTENGLYFKKNNRYRTLTQKVPFPQQFEVNVKLENKATSNYVELYLFSDEKGKMYSDKVGLKINVFSHSLRIFESSNSISHRLESISFPNNRRNVDFRNQNLSLLNQSHFRFFIDLKKGKMHVYINGIKHPNPINFVNLDPKKLNSNFTFLARSGVRKLLLKTCSVKKWNGSLPNSNTSKQRAKITNQIGKRIDLQNGDHIYGHFKSLKEGIASIETKYGIYNLRINNLVGISLGESKQKEIKMRKNDALIHLTDGSRFILTIEKITSKKLYGTGQAFAEKVEIDLKNIQQIEFEKSLYSLPSSF